MKIPRNLATRTASLSQVSACDTTSTPTSAQLDFSRYSLKMLQLAPVAEMIRPDKVNSIRFQIQSDKYQINLEAIVNGMLNDL